MTDTNMLEKKIQESGLMKKHIAQLLNITPYCLAQKISNESEFKASEISILCEVLNVKTLKEKEAIFFKSKVD